MVMLSSKIRWGGEAEYGRGLRKFLVLAGLVLLPCSAMMAHAQVVRVPLPNSSFPISQGVWVGKTLYLSGMLDPAVGKGASADTKTQTINAIQSIEKALEKQNLTLGDVVMMHVYLVGDQTKGGKMDFSGFMEGYTKYFGTKEQPNKPARSAMEVRALAAPDALVEIEVIAVKP
jgi:enamine deaminase RidA (YjgF/YER057c/UK114 family)